MKYFALLFIAACATKPEPAPEKSGGTITFIVPTQPPPAKIMRGVDKDGNEYMIVEVP